MSSAVYWAGIAFLIMLALAVILGKRAGLLLGVGIDTWTLIVPAIVFLLRAAYVYRPRT